MIPASERGITVPNQPETFGRRALFQRAARRAEEVALTTGVVSVATNLWLPHEAHAAAQRPEPEAPLTADERFSQLRESARIWLPRIEPNTWEPKEVYNPGDVIYSTVEKEKVLRLRIDDFWWAEEFSAMLDTLQTLGVPATLNPVGDAVEAFPDLVRRADKLKAANGQRLVEWENHTDNHGNLDQIPRATVIDHILPQNHSLERVLRRPVRQNFIAPPGGAGAYLGQPVDKELKGGAQQLKLAILMWSKDTGVWNGASVDEAVDNVYPFTSGDIIILHGLANDRLALPGIVRLAREDGYRFELMSSIPVRGNGL